VIFVKGNRKAVIIAKAITENEKFIRRKQLE